MNTQEDKKRKISKNILLHLHPSVISEEAIKFTRTFGLGGMAFLLIFIQFITGIMLRFYYEPIPGLAYESILIIQNNVLFGRLIRNIHHWSGIFLVLISFFHLLRVFFTGAFQDLRKVNWLIGIALLILVILSNFTGYLLPWDQLAYWAITVSTGILQYIPFVGNGIREFVIAGNEVNADTLLVFYNLHSAVIPALFVILLIYHIWRVRKAGGILFPSDSSNNNYVPAYPNLVFKEGVVAITLLAVIFVFSTFFSAPLLEVANPNFSLNPTKAPWYFAGIQELLMHFHPFVAGFFIPVFVIFLLSYVPFIKIEYKFDGKWFFTVRGKEIAVISMVSSLFLTIIWIIVNEYFINFEKIFEWLPALVSNGIIPLIILLMFFYILYIISKKYFKLEKSEFVLSIFVFLVTAFVVLTLTGIFFRGVDMELTFPWNVL